MLKSGTGFQDIRSLFYKDFLSTRTSEMQEKGLVSEIKQSKQNFRTHDEPEISLISGELPILFEPCNNDNAIVAIFGGKKSGDDIVGFGAEQVILVRDDPTKTKVCEFVGKNALVLTTVEYKGLEFERCRTPLVEWPCVALHGWPVLPNRKALAPHNVSEWHTA
ncbi:hypothetical protein Tco_0072526 [Tanacetum coccineum]